MAKVTVGTAYIQLMPSMDRFSKKVNSEMGDIARVLKKDIESSIGGSLQDATKAMDRSAAGPTMGRKLAGGIKRGIDGAALGIGIGAALVGGIGIALAAKTLQKGFARALNIEDAQAKLKGLKFTSEEIKGVTNNVLDAVRGTAFSLDGAMGVAATALAAGVQQGTPLTDYLKLVGDTATITGGSINEIGSIFNKVQTSGKLMTMEMNQLQDRGLPVFSWLQKEMGVTSEALREMVSRGEIDSATFRDVIQKNIGGAALASGDTTRGAYANLQAALGRLGAVALTGGLPYFNEILNKTMVLVDGLTEKLQPLAEGFWETFGPKMVEAFDPEAFMNGTKEFFTYFKDAWISLKEVAQNPAVQNVLKYLSNFFSKPENLAGFVKTSLALWGISKILPILMGAMSMGGGLVKMLAGGGLFASLTGGLGKWFGKLPGEATKMGWGKQFASIFTGGLGGISAASGGGIAASLAGFGGAFMKFLGPIGLIATLISSIIPRMMEIPGFTDSARAGMADFFGQAWEQLQGIFVGLMEAFTPIIDIFTQLIFNMATMITGEKDEAKALMEVLKIVANTILGALYGVKILVGFISLGISAIMMAISSIINIYIAMINSAGESLSRLGELFGKNWGWNLAPVRPPDIVSQAGNLDFTPPKFLATGGDVLPQKGGTLSILAEAGEAETVVNRGVMNRTLSAMEKKLQNSPGEAVVINMNINPSQGMNETELARKVRREFVKQNKRYAT
jgi:tape measure domain-containing protein